MDTYSKRFEDITLEFLEEKIETRGTNLVINREMDARAVDYERGYIAACRDAAIFITKDATKKLNEETS